MKRVVAVWLAMFMASISAEASTMNLDPYFSLGSTSIDIDVGGTKSKSPSVFGAVGTKLNWISPHLGAEFRFGFGGQYNSFNGDISTYTQYLLKPEVAVTRQWDLYALAGLTTMSLTIANASYTNTGLSYGLGVAYHIPNESIAITGEWFNFHSSTDQSVTSISGMDITGLTLAVTFEYF